MKSVFYIDKGNKLTTQSTFCYVQWVSEIQTRMDFRHLWNVLNPDPMFGFRHIGLFEIRFQKSSDFRSLDFRHLLHNVSEVVLYVQSLPKKMFSFLNKTLSRCTYNIFQKISHYAQGVFVMFDNLIIKGWTIFVLYSFNEGYTTSKKTWFIN